MPNTLTKITAGLLSVLTVGMTISSLYNISANAESSTTPKNYEAILSLEFKDAVRITDLSKALKKDVGDQKNVDIISTNTKLDFEGKIQTFTRSNEEQLGTQNFFDSQKKNQSAFLQTIVNLKEKSESGKTVENKEAVAPLLNKYTKQELKKTTAKYKNQTVGVNMIILGGTLANMNKIRSGETAKLATKSDLTNVLELQKQSNEIKGKVDKASTPEAKQEVISKELAKVMPMSADMPKLELNKDKIALIDKIAIKDLNGNVSVSQNELKSKLGLTEEQASQVSTAMTNYNNLPLEAKDNTSSATQSITTSQEMKSEIQEQKGLDEKIAQVMFGGVTASAYWNGYCDAGAYVAAIYWWGFRAKENRCSAQSHVRYGTNIAGFIAALFSVACYYAQYWPIAGGVCAGLAGIAAWYYSSRLGDIQYYSNYCEWINLDINMPSGYMNIWC